MLHAAPVRSRCCRRQRAPAMPLDNDPIYCAEQIVIPPDLGDILKAYAKEVIRNEPDDIFEFSAK